MVLLVRWKERMNIPGFYSRADKRAGLDEGLFVSLQTKVGQKSKKLSHTFSLVSE